MDNDARADATGALRDGETGRLRRPSRSIHLGVPELDIVVPEGFSPGVLVISGPANSLKTQVACHAAESQGLPVAVVCCRELVSNYIRNHHPEFLSMSSATAEDSVTAALRAARAGAVVVVDGLPGAADAYDGSWDIDKPPVHLTRDRRLVMLLLDALSREGVAKRSLHIIINEQRRSPARMKLCYADDIILGSDRVHLMWTRDPSYRTKYRELQVRGATYNVTRVNGERRSLNSAHVSAKEGLYSPDTSRLKCLAEDPSSTAVVRSGAYYTVFGEQLGPGAENAVADLYRLGLVPRIHKEEEIAWNRRFESLSAAMASRSKPSTPADQAVKSEYSRSRTGLQEKLSRLRRSQSTTRSRTPRRRKRRGDGRDPLDQ